MNPPDVPDPLHFVDMTRKSGTSLLNAAARTWDAIVVGAGPAGCIAARELSRVGKRVLLVEKAVFPRQKVCGGCLNGAAMGALRQIGLGDLPAEVDAQPLDRVEIHCGGRQASLPLRNNVSIARDVFDAALARAAVNAGTTFLMGTTARPDGHSKDVRWVQLASEGEHARVTAKVVVAAAGLNGWRDDGNACQPQRAANSRIGAGTMLRDSVAGVAPGVISMSVGKGGYVGMVLTGGGRVDVASAFDKTFLSACGGPATAATEILRQAGVACPAELANAPWVGTPALTHHLTHVADDRLFIIGDAAGYVEPFTGEGMAWAIRSGCAVTPLVAGAIDNYSPEWGVRWEDAHRQMLAGRMWECGAVGRLLRRPKLASLAVRCLSWAPWLASPLLRRINREPVRGEVT